MCSEGTSSDDTSEKAVLLQSLSATGDRRSTSVDEPDNMSVGKPLRALMSNQKIALLATMYLSYVMAIFSSSSLEVSMPAALDDRALGLNQTDFALALSAGQIATVVGKIFCGFVVDLRGATTAFYEALLLIGIIMFVGIACVSAGLNKLALLSFVGMKLAKSAIWPAMAKAAKAAFDSSIFGRVWGVLVTSSRFGAVSGGLVLSPVVLFGWAWPGLLVAGGCVLAAVALRVQTIRDQFRPSMTGQHVQASGLKSPNSAISMRDAVKLYGRDSKLLLLVASEGMLLAVMDTSSLIPLYLHNQLGIALDEAARVASLFPLGMVCATFVGGFMYDALTPHRRANMLCGLGVCSAGSYALFATETSAWLAGMLLFCAGACFAPAKYLPPTIYTLENVDPQQ